MVNRVLENKRAKRAKYTRNRRKHYLHVKRNNSYPTKSQRQRNRLIEDSEEMKLPKVFSLRKNTDGVIEFINRLKRQEKKDKRIYLNMRQVEVITNGTISLLLSVANDFTYKGKRIIGSKPKNRVARKILELSGFYNYMHGYLEYQEESEVNSNTILQQGSKVIQPQKTAEIVRSAMKTIHGDEKRNKKLQGLFIELMANSVNHGFPKDEQKKKWILSTSHFKEDNCVSFSFIDNGVGIIKTLNGKLGRQIFDVFIDNSDLLISAFEGKIGSRTGLSFRGKGLPFVKQTIEDNYISNLFILTNNVVLDFKNEIFYETNIAYSGTFYYFEVNQENKL